MLINFIYMFQVIYKGFKCRLKFAQSAFIYKEFCMKRIKSKPSSAVFSVMSEKNQCGIFGKSGTIKTFLFQTYLKLDSKGLRVFTLAHTAKNCAFSVKQNLHILFLTTPISFRMSLSQEFYNKSLISLFFF